MVILADLHINQAILEPSAGTGRIAEAIKPRECECIEINYNAAKLLEQRGFLVHNTDFLTWLPDFCKYDRILMNPPFSNDIEHVRHAYDLLAEGGRMVAIMSPGPFFRSDKKSKEFRDWLAMLDYTEEDLPAGTFKASGTNVSAKLIIIDK
jgi:type I restriction-modification system DNA methylase subunit